jgi:hypothetical protein
MDKNGCFVFALQRPVEFWCVCACKRMQLTGKNNPAAEPANDFSGSRAQRH